MIKNSLKAVYRSISNFVKRQLRNRIDVEKYLNNYNVSVIQVAILNLIDQQKKSVYKIANVKNLTPSKKILSGYKYISKSQNNIEIQVPDLNLYELNNAFVNSRSSAILMGGTLYYESINHNERFNEGFISFHNNKNAVVHKNEVESLEEGFFLAGDGSFNWYHWIIEILPKVIYIDHKQHKTILVDESCRQVQSMADSLKILIQNLEVDIVYLNPQKTYRIKKLYFINEINKLMFNTLNLKVSSLPLYYFRKESLQKLTLDLQHGTDRKKITNGKFFLERKNTHRIAENEEEVYDTLYKLDFSMIDLGKLSFKEQNNKFRNAKVIVGTTGAAWTNIIFCKPKTKVIIFMPNNYKDYQFYEEIAGFFDVDAHYLYYDNNNKNHCENDFEIDINQLKTILNTENE